MGRTLWVTLALLLLAPAARAQATDGTPSPGAPVAPAVPVQPSPGAPGSPSTTPGISGDSGFADEVDSSLVPTYTDVVQRGLRSRIDLGGRYGVIGLPDPPIRLDIDEPVNNDDLDDADIGGSVILGFDRPFGAPLAGELFAQSNFDLDGDSPISPFLDDTSNLARFAQIYSAFIGLSGAPGDGFLEAITLNVGRQTEMVESPVTYDGASLGLNLKLPELRGRIGGKLWAGLDAPVRLPSDPFTRLDNKAYRETYQDLSGFVSPTGGVNIVRERREDPILNFVGGLRFDGSVYGIGWIVDHTILPTVQRSTLGASYLLDIDYLMARVALDTKASDFIPRNATLRGDAMTWDGTTRVGLRTTLQFLEDVTAYDSTFRAFNPANQFNQAAADGIEVFRAVDNIRHLNIGPAQEHILVILDAERQLPFGFTALIRGRLRQHFDAADLDYWRSNIYEGGVGIGWSTGFAFDVGTEVAVGALDSGLNDGFNYDLVGEGLSSYVENRTWVRTVLLEGKVSNLAEVFVRRQDIQTKGIIANGQWSGAFATTLRYDIVDFWSMSLRVDADALSPVDTLNGSGYIGGLVATTLRF